MTQPKLISLTTAAGQLGISTSLLRRYCRTQRVTNVATTEAGHYVFTAMPRIKPGRPAGRPRKDAA